MPVARVHDADLYYEDTGGSGPVVLLSAGIPFDRRVFDAQVRVLSERYRCVAYDHRGLGRSSLPEGGRVSVDTLAADAAGLIVALDLAPVHFVGLATGGLVGLRVAARHPSRVRSLVVMGTTAAGEPPAHTSRYRLISLIVRTVGPRWIAPRVMPLLFGRTFLHDRARLDERRVYQERLAGVDRSVHRLLDGVVARPGMADELDRIAAPCLVMVGEEDRAVPPERSETLHARLADSRMVRIPGAGHTMTVEQPASVNAALQAFLRRVDRSAPATR